MYAFWHLDKTNGNLVGLHWKNPGEEIIKESRLGENFRILLPLPHYEANYFLITNQKLFVSGGVALTAQARAAYLRLQSSYDLQQKTLGKKSKHYYL